MNNIVLVFLVIWMFSAYAEEEEKFDNSPFQGKNQYQRINANADKLAELLKEVAALKADVERLKAQINALAGKSNKGVQLTPPEEN